MNPYVIIKVPAIARVYDALVRLARQANAPTVAIGVRALAVEAGLASAGGVSAMLKRMVADGQIAYDAGRSLITLLIDHDADQGDQARDRVGDRQPHADARQRARGDQARDRDQRADRVIGDHASDRVGDRGARPDAAAAAACDHASDRPSREESRREEEGSRDAQMTPPPEWRPWLAAGVAPACVPKLMAAAAGRDAAEFSRQVALAAAMPRVDSPVGLVIHRWLVGRDVQEPNHGGRTRPDATQSRRLQRGAAPRRSGNQTPWTDEDEKAWNSPGKTLDQLLRELGLPADGGRSGGGAPGDC